MSNSTRREFIQKSSVATATAGLLAKTQMASANVLGTNDVIRVGFIGPGRRGFGAHVKSLVALRKAGVKVDLVAVNDVYTINRNRAAEYIRTETGIVPRIYDNYRELLADDSIDAVCIGTPDHWHAKQTLNALKAGKHVYCEKPMTHTVDEAAQVVAAWKKTGLVVQVGVQSTSCPIWDRAREMIDEGKLGKIIQFQTEYFRNSKSGMSRHNKLTKEMSPKNIDFKQFLGVEEGLSADRPFDREVFGQWRCHWDFGYGMFTDLFVHRVTGLLKATGLRYPGRVVGGGGIFLEYDGREVTDVGSLIADFHEGVQGVVSSTMIGEEERLDHIVRGHNGLLKFSKRCYVRGPHGDFEYIPERPQVTGNSKLKKQSITAKASHESFNISHMANFIDAIRNGEPKSVNNDPELAAAAVMVVNLAVRSYREGRVFQIDPSGKVGDGDSSWAAKWETMSKNKSKPNHVPGWKAGDTGSVIYPHEHQKMAGPWKDGNPPIDG